MPKYYVGDFIRETRERRGYTQEELCYGICSVPSLSRIENGVQVPGSRRLDALLQRLGCGNQVFNEFVSKEDIVLYKLVQNIENKIIKRDYDELEKLILKLEDIVKDKEEFEKQYLIFAKAIVINGKEKDKEKALKMYIDAVHITLPEFNGYTPLEKNLLTYDELAIINAIASLYSEIGKIEKALTLGFWIKNYMETRFMEDSQKKEKYPMVLFNLTNWLGKRKRYEDALKIANSGIKFCTETGSLRAFPFFIFNKACALAELNNKEEAERFFTQAAIIFESMDKITHKEKTLTWCKEQYNIQLKF